MVRSCLPLLAESTVAAVPIVRSVFECGVMAQWLGWFPGSEDNVLEESHGLMAALTKDLSRSKRPHYQEGAARLPACQLPTGSCPCTSLSANSLILLRSYTSGRPR